MTTGLPNRQITNTRNPPQTVNGGRAATKHYLKHTTSASKHSADNLTIANHISTNCNCLRLNRVKKENLYIKKKNQKIKKSRNAINLLQQKETQKAKNPTQPQNLQLLLLKLVSLVNQNQHSN